MGNPIETLDRCSERLAAVQSTLTKTRRVASVVAGVAVGGGFALLLWKLVHSEDPLPTDFEPKD